MRTAGNYTLKWLFLDFDGRIRRVTFGLSCVLIVVVYSWMLYQLMNTPETSWQFGAWGLAFMAAFLITAWIMAALSAKRLHDLGFSGYLAIAVFLPIFTFIFFFVLCLWQGNPGRNQFGEPPIRKSRKR